MTPEEAHRQNEELQAAYQHTFNTPFGKRVLADLAAYCGARKSTFDPDDRQHAFNEGKRDVFLRMQEFMSLELEDIYRLRGMGRVRTTGESE